MNKPEPKQEIAIAEVGDVFHIYTASDKAKTLIRKEAPQFGALFKDDAFDMLYLNACYDVVAVRVYLEQLANEKNGMSVAATSARNGKRKKFIDGLMLRIGNDDPAINIEVWQRRPYTAACIEMAFGLGEICRAGIGFSKVSLPDKWDMEEGQIIAARRALADIWRQMKK